MKQAIPYLTFPGSCAEALDFYCEVFDAEVTVRQTLREAPVPSPPEAGELIFNAELQAGDLVLKASDNPEALGTAPATSPISVFVTCEQQEEHRRTFERLAAEGQIVFPPEGGFAMVIDRFGVPWMLAGPTG